MSGNEACLLIVLGVLVYINVRSGPRKPPTSSRRGIAPPKHRR